MAALPSMLGEVFWGDPSQPMPDWREHPRPDGEDDDDHELTDEERERLIGKTGLDPDEMWPDEPEEGESVSKSFQRLLKSNEEFWKQEGCL